MKKLLQKINKAVGTLLWMLGALIVVLGMYVFNLEHTVSTIGFWGLIVMVLGVQWMIFGYLHDIAITLEDK